MDGKNVIKFKGPAKNLVDPEWFESQYEDISRQKQIIVESHFRIDWHKLDIIRKDTLYTLGISLGNKRKQVFKDQTWVDTDPVHISDLSRLDNIGKQILHSQRSEIKQLQLQIHNEKFMKEGELDERKKTEISMLSTERSPTSDSPLLDKMDQPETTPDEKTEKKRPRPPQRKWTMFPDLLENESETDDEDLKPPDIMDNEPETDDEKTKPPPNDEDLKPPDQSPDSGRQ